jgi:hypothetical protein
MKRSYKSNTRQAIDSIPSIRPTGLSVWSVKICGTESVQDIVFLVAMLAWQACCMLWKNAFSPSGQNVVRTEHEI